MIKIGFTINEYSYKIWFQLAVASENVIKSDKDDTATDNSRCKMMTVAHMTLCISWAKKKCIFAKLLGIKGCNNITDSGWPYTL